MKWHHIIIFLVTATTLGYTQYDPPASKDLSDKAVVSQSADFHQDPSATGFPVSIVPKAVKTLVFHDGTIAHLDVSAPSWSWLYAGLIYQPIEGNLITYKNVRQSTRQWWCGWLCKKTETVKQPVKVSGLTLEALGYTGNAAGDQVTDQGRSTCSSCSSTTHYVHNFGLVPWAGGGGFQGIGFRGTVYYQGQTLVLHDHWGTDRAPTGALVFPADFD